MPNVALPTLGVRVDTISDKQAQDALDNITKGFCLAYEFDLVATAGNFGTLATNYTKAFMIKITDASAGFNTLDMPVSPANERVMAIWNADAGGQTITIRSGNGSGTTTTLAAGVLCWVYWKGNNLVKIA